MIDNYLLKRKLNCHQSYFNSGADRIRTNDHLVMSQALYLAKLQPLKKANVKISLKLFQ